jgi:site-specific recombinase XerD
MPHVIDLQRNLRPWLAAYDTWSRVTRGRGLVGEDPLFPNLQNARGEALGRQGIADVINRYAAAAGIRAELGERISSHGFRRGFAQEASARGVSAQEIARLQRRKSVESVLVYTGRPSNPFESSVYFLVEGLDDGAFSTDDVYAHLSAMHQRFRRR